MFFSISSSKLATYILPMFPPLAAFTGSCRRRSVRDSLPAPRCLAAGLALFVAVGLLVYSQRRNGMIPPQAVGWAIAAALAALIAVARAGSAA